MDFFESQQSLTPLEWILRSSVSFIFLLLLAKLMGQRSISQLRFLDFVVALILGNILAHPLSDEKLGLEGSMITTAVIVVLYVTATWLSLRWPMFKRYLDPPPITIIEQGQIQFHALTKARISIEYVFAELRKEKVENIQKISLALWEPGGTISIFMNTQNEPLTPAHMKIETPPFSLTRPIIVNGKIDASVLKEIGKDWQWLMNKIGPAYGKIHNVKLATIDGNDQVRVHS